MSATGEDRYEVPSGTEFLGRTFHEYRRMFDLAPADLTGRAVLDCPGGPSSFTAVAAEFADRAVAVDPVYGPPPAAVEATCRETLEHVRRQLREKRDLFVWDEYGDVDTRMRFLRAAVERFLADYARRPGRYTRAKLPRLPFADGAFELVLSGSFLFLYDDRFDRAFHVAALEELARVGGEVRVFPLSSLDRTRSAFVEPVTEELRDAGYAVGTVAVPYEFQPGATDMLVVEQ